MFLLGLTGSIGMGKSTTAKLFVEEGCALWDADAAVHRLYGENGEAVAPIRDVFPEAIVKNSVSRDKLKEIILNDATALKKIEAIVHPLVGQDRAAFIAQARVDIVVLDIPLIYETGGQDKVDAVACVIIDAETQKHRVMERGTMTSEQFEVIRSKQLPADEKAARADYVITTDTVEHARQQVQNVVRDIREKQRHA
ncbi:dephospho-CoA kinase [Sulfitobacter sp. M57]|uniref:dephospho-CoA kinase n=1 Tax=unclassified Sulfitobacter TaxID=196795 RepID=UPI0023E0FD09|nr:MULTISPECIES: dephospho-CoA kinase [unclassified Sulfitobacter]MDF3415005.1 dephospho-CoA kinase [Sulfitobacter sp. KE5]MDF3422486.1 dephospho-CoA kinase [Sulfitobacter sp. KE43]MDF3433551.1 dephospho-CoA kinase [Sulfitobacter sp. KE42]MDF3459191.1 dephospho-CoA kinase [Sulfitobacter sp. S74]MDF3463090.1 dephospho-CoA kinase [Sulfitobacter sp. Ks18]